MPHRLIPPLLKSRFMVLALLLVFLHGAIAWFSPYVAYDVFPDLTPIIIYVYLAGLAGVIILFVPAAITRLAAQSRATRHTALILMVATGFILRLTMFASTPILEDDWARYLWEGAVGNAGISPYAHAPADGFGFDQHNNQLEPAANPQLNQLRALSADNDDYAYEVAYPYLTTIYPGVTQAAFRLANAITPFSLTTWRTVLLVADTVSIYLLVLVLSAWGRSPLWAALYWWNPIVILEGFNSAHMDILLVPALLASIYAVRRAKPGWAGVFLGLGVGIKIWPILLAPLFIGPLIKAPISIGALARHWAPLLRYSAALLGVSLLTLLPLLVQAFEPESGLVAYSSEWRKNSFLFSLIAAALGPIASNPDLAARLCIALILTIAVIVLAGRLRTAQKLPPAMLWIIAGLFFLAPAGYPWYMIWLLPLMTLTPLPGLLMLCVTLPLYYLRFPLSLMEYSWVFDYIIAPIEFGLPLIVLGLYARNRPIAL